MSRQVPVLHTHGDTECNHETLPFYKEHAELLPSENIIAGLVTVGIDMQDKQLHIE